MNTCRLTSWVCVFTVICSLLYGSLGTGAEPQRDGVSLRKPWTASRVAGSPESPLPYITERAFPLLKFNQCLDLVSMPGSNRLFVVEQSGKIFSFPNQADIAEADLVVDLAKAIPGVEQVYSLAFHPDFERNGWCFVCYILAADQPEGTHVSRFAITETDPPRIDVTTELPIITWRSGGHNGCSLKFGPDGCLYISTGDAGPANPPDIFKTGQDLSDLLSSILRIDVDHKQEGRNYFIPLDNPFLNVAGARGEIWAYGLRNPWRMSFDPLSGDLWVGDVGWELWEMLYRIERGGNYGWAVTEGLHSTHPEWPRGPTPILPPAIEHPHSESSSITEGLTYYGKRLKELQGTHIYSDYDTGKFWGFRYEKGQILDHRELADTTHRVVGFGEARDGEFFILDHTAGTIHRLVRNPQPDTSRFFPQTLIETGLFTSVKDQAPAPGVVAYGISAEPWADHAVAQRYVAAPQQLSIKTDLPAWVFPTDTVLVKTLSLPRGDGTSRFVETQILHFDGAEWMPYTYEWTDDQTDARLVPAAGTERTFEIDDPQSPGGRRNQTWRFSGRAECQRCHNRWSGPPLAFNTPQLHRERDVDGTKRSQLDWLTQIGLLEPSIPDANRPQLVNPYDETASLDQRARAYLHANCAHCHRLHAGGAVLSHMHYDLDLEKTNMIGTRPTQGTFGIHAANVLAPADPERSVLLYRMSKLGSGRMPHLGSSEVDQAGVRLIREWQRAMPAHYSKDHIGDQSTARQRAEEKAKLERVREATAAEQQQLLNQLFASTSGALLVLGAIDQQQLPDAVVRLAIDCAAEHRDASVRDLFERFLPESRRIKRLGTTVTSAQILALKGEAERGQKLFFESAVMNCKNCHRIQKEGKEIGPELTSVGKKLTRAQLLESILEPSRQIEPKFVTHLIETTAGQLLTGLLVSDTDQGITLKDAQGSLVKIPRDQIEQSVPQRQSLMPDLLFRDMTAQQLADLVEYLSTLK